MENRQRSKGFSPRVGLLALAAFIWGTAFVAQSVGMDHIGPFTFTAVRSFLGAIVLLPVIFLSAKLQKGDKTPKTREKSFLLRNKALLMGGSVCGLFLGTASLLQQTGMQTTTAGKAGFLTALYIVLVPVLGIFLGRRPGWKVWAGVVIALLGAYLLSIKGEAVAGEAFMSLGDALVLLSALFFSFHILVIDKFSALVDGVKLSCVQFFVAGVLATVLAFIFEAPAVGDILKAWGPLLYTGVLSSGVAYTLQILGQRDVEPTVASLVLSLESVFAALAGWVVLGQGLSPREIIGCCLVFAAVILAQLPAKKAPLSQNT